MKVAFDHRIFARQRYGGVSRYFVELLNHLPAQNVSASVVAPVYINNYLTADSVRRPARGIHLPHDFAGLPELVGLANRFAAPFAWAGSDADIVHETYFAKNPVGTARRRVVTVYDMILELYAPKATWAIAAKRAAVNRADHVICISENTRTDLIRLLDVDPARTSVVYLGYSLAGDASDTQVPDARRRPWLLYVGNRSGYKNFGTLLEAFGNSPILRQFELIAFGGQAVSLSESRKISRLGLADRVRFDSGSDQKLAEYYRGATAFVYPSLYEGFGIPPLEAMSHGCPVVCSSAGSVPEVVGNAGVYFDPTSAEDMRAALERVVTSEALQTNLRARGYARIPQFSWSKCAAETAGIYRGLM